MKRVKRINYIVIETKLLVVSTLWCIQKSNYHIVYFKVIQHLNQCYLNFKNCKRKTFEALFASGERIMNFYTVHTATDWLEIRWGCSWAALMLTSLSVKWL